MTTLSERIERDLRMALGDLTVQLVITRAELATLQEAKAAAELDKQPAPESAAAANGWAKEAHPT